MWHIEEVELTQFISHQHTVYKLLQGKVVMVYGFNLDEVGTDSNGSGKSSLLKGIAIGITGVIDKLIGKDDFVMDGFSQSEIKIKLYNKFLHKRLDIHRTIYKGNRSNKVVIREDGEINNNLVGVDDTNQRIIDLIGVSREDILNFFIIDQENQGSFFKSTDLAQKQIISRFCDFSLVDMAIEKVEVDVEKEQSTILQVEQEIAILLSNAQIIQEQIDYERNERAAEAKQKTSSLQQEISNIKQLNIKCAKDLIDQTIKLAEVQQSIDSYEIKDIGDLGEEARILEDKIKTKKNKRISLEKTKSDLEKILLKVVECPNCHHKWSLSDVKVDIHSTNQSLIIIQKSLKAVESNLEIAKRKLDKLKTMISLSKSDEENKRLDGLRLQRIQNFIDELKKQINHRKNLILNKNKEIKKLNDFEIDSKRISELELKLKNNEILVSDKSVEMELASERKRKLEFLSNMFGYNGFKTFLVNKTLNGLEGAVNYHLKRFNTNLLIKIDGYKILKSGKVVEKIDVSVTKDGDYWKKFRRFSEGQKGRINVCGILAIQKLINQSSPSGGLDFLGLDEFFEGLDQTGQRSSLNILKLSGITTLVVSHHNNNIGWENQLKIKYKNGVSKLII